MLDRSQDLTLAIAGHGKSAIEHCQRAHGFELSAQCLHPQALSIQLLSQAAV